ncbi:MAG: hypothetical protein ABI550_03140 [Ignavibacteriaceae bacterium]
MHAVAGNKKVFLYWDDVAEQSVDPFLNYKKDFEGYLIYKSEEPEFQDIKTITDSKGDGKYWKPIAQYDLVDTIKGPDPIGINGAHFWRGNETGLQHSYIDTNVVNGQTYYYACVAYDQGDPNYGTAGLIPSETTKIISQDLVGNITFVDINCRVVVPNSPAAGYIPPEVKGDFSQVTQGIGTGNVKVTVLDESQIKNGADYKIIFNTAGDSTNYKTVSYSIVRQLDSVTDTIKARVDSSTFGSDKFSPAFDGLSISVNNYDSVNINLDKSGWLKGFSTYYMPISADKGNPSRDVAWPADYRIEFLAEKSITTPFTKIPINFKVMNVTRGDEVQAEVIDNNANKVFDLGDEIVIIEYVGTQYKLTWRVGYFKDENAPFIAPPVAGDIFLVTTNKPFYSGDYFSFSTQSSKVDNSLAQANLDKINVVPNPYITSNKWEKRNLNQTGRGERRIDFTNLPSNTTIRIYSLAGALIKTLYKDSSPTDGSLSWNLITEDGMDIAYGIYIYHLDAPGIGEKIGKFAIIK